MASYKETKEERLERIRNQVAQESNRERRLENARQAAKFDIDYNRFRSYVTGIDNYFNANTTARQETDPAKMWEYYSKDRSQDSAALRSDYDWAKSWMESNKSRFADYDALSAMFEGMPGAFDAFDQSNAERYKYWGKFKNSTSAAARYNRDIEKSKAYQEAENRWKDSLDRYDYATIMKLADQVTGAEQDYLKSRAYGLMDKKYGNIINGQNYDYIMGIAGQTEGDDKKYLEAMAYDALSPAESEKRYKDAIKAKNADATSHWGQMYNSKTADFHARKMVDVYMDNGNNLYEEMMEVSKLPDGKEKDQRLKTVYGEMDALGIDPEEWYPMFTGDGEFSWSRLGDLAGGAAKSGLSNWNQAWATTGDLIFGNALALLGWEDNPFREAKKGADTLAAIENINLSRKAERIGGGLWHDVAGGLSSAVATVPDMLSIYATGGASAAAELADNAIMNTGTFLQKAGVTVSNMANNPSFWTSFARNYGQDYEYAKELGADDWTAALGATFTSLVNAGIEVGISGNSGIQGLANNAADEKLLTKWAISAVEEGNEELLQGFVSRLVNKVAYGDDQEIFDFSTMAKEWTMGTAVGSLLGGGQIATGAAVSSVKQTRANTKIYTELGQKVLKQENGVKNLLGMASNLSTDIQKLAEKVSKHPNAKNVGMLYSKVQNELNGTNKKELVQALKDEGISEKQASQIASIVIQDGYGSITEAQEAQLAKEIIGDERIQRAMQKVAESYQADDSGMEDGDLTDEAEPVSVKTSGTEYNMLESAPDTEVGKVVFTSTGEDAKVKVNDSIDTTAEDVLFSSETDAKVFQKIAKVDGITVSAANAVWQLYQNTDLDADTFMTGAVRVLRQGMMGYDIKLLDGAAKKLSVQEQEILYAAGQGMKEKANAPKLSKTPGKKGVYYRGRDGKAMRIKDYAKSHDLNQQQRTAIDVMEKLANVMGVRFNIYETWDENGVTYYLDENGDVIEGEPNGFYDQRTGEIYVDLNAGADYEGVMLFTVAHELTHFMRQFSAKHFHQIAELVTSQAGFSDDLETLVKNKQEEALLDGKKLTYDQALEEVVADSMETILKDGRVLQFMKELKKADQGSWEKVKQWFKNLANDLRMLIDAYRNQAAQTAEGKKVQAFSQELLQQIESIFAEGILEASQNYQNALNPGQEGVAVNEDGDPVAYSTETGTVMLSMRTFREGGKDTLKNYLQKCVSSKRLTKAEMNEMLNGIQEIYDICQEFKDKYAPFGTWSEAEVVRDTHGKPVFSVVTPNGEYKMNLDFSLVCKKRRTLDAVFNEMAKQGILDDFELGQKTVVKINELIRRYGFETACALCFVDAKRFRQASMADSFARLYNELVESLVPEDQKKYIDRFNYGKNQLWKPVEGGIDTWSNSRLDFSHLDQVMKSYGKNTVEYKAAKYIKTHPEGRKLVMRGDFMGSEGFDAVKTQNPALLKLYNSKKGTGGPKAAFGDVQYLNEVIQKAKSWTPAKAFSVGGIRVQSFSDYVPRMVFDYVQMIYDLAATKLPAHAYSKEALFVKQFGLTGIKINMSLIPAMEEGGIAPGLDADGNYVWAGESFDFETAKQIQNAEGYTENCGTICVGVSKQHILKLLSDPDIRMVIPYHKSGLNPIVAHMNKIDGFTDYSTLKTNPGGCQSTMDKDGKKVEKDFDFYASLQKTGDPKLAVREYLNWCAQHDYTPKFAEFAWHENYYKLIEDFTVFDKDGKYVPQREVKAVFPTEASAFGSMKELIRQGLEEDAIVEGKRDASLGDMIKEIQATIPKTEAEIEETQVEQADRDLEATTMMQRRRSSESNTSYKEDLKIMEQEFKRIVRAFETQARRNGKKDVQINELKAALKAEAKKHREDMKTWETEFNRLLEAYEDSGKDLATMEEEYLKLLKAYDRADTKVQRLEADIEHRKEAAKEKVDSRKSTELRQKIRNLKEDLQKQALGKSGERYIPQGLMDSIVAVCEAIDDSTYLYRKDGSLNKGQAERNAVAERLRDLKEAYHDLKTNEDAAIALEYESDVEEHLNELRTEFMGKNLSELSRNELERMYEILKSISESVIGARKLIGWNENEDVYVAGYTIAGEQNGIVEGRKNGKRNALQKSWDYNQLMTLSAMRAVERISDWNMKSALVRLFNDLEAGVRKKNFFMMNAYKDFEKLSTGEAYQDAVYKPFGKVLTDDKGRKFRVSKMQMMQAILSYERETQNENQIHISKGGLEFADFSYLGKGKYKTAIEKENIRTIRQAQAVEAIAQFREELKNDQWAQDYMNAARKFFNETAKNALNETHMQLKHRLIATDKAYIPYEIDKSLIYREITDTNDIRQTISGYGMLQQLKQNSAKPLVITGLNNIIDRHIDQVATVYGLGVPIRNFNKVWNVEVGGNTVKGTVEDAWGKNGVKIIENAVKDLQGPRNADTTINDVIRGKYISAQFALNLSVVLKQIGSMYSATTELDKMRNPLSMLINLGATMKNMDEIMAEVDKYTASAWMRRQGLSDGDLATLKTVAQRSKLSRWWANKPTALHPYKWITAMDHAVALSLWVYCKNDTQARTGLEGEALLQETAKMYDKVIERTQSMADVLHRPELQKSKNWFAEQFGMFKTDLFQNVGNLTEKYNLWSNNKTKENTVKLAKAVYALTSNLIWGTFITVLSAFWRYKPDRYRDKETGELTFESIAKAVGWDMVGEVVGYLNPAFGSDVFSFVDNIVNRKQNEIFGSLGLESINSLVSAVYKMADGEVAIKDLEGLAIQVGNMLGVPANAVIRSLRAVKNHAADIANGEFLSFNTGYDKSRAQHIATIIESYEDDPVNAKDAYNQVVELLAEDNAAKKNRTVTDDDRKDAVSSLKTALGKKYKDNEVSEELAEDLLLNLFGEKEEDAYWIIDRWNYAKDNGSSEDYEKYDDFKNAVRTGTDLKAVIKTYTDNGVKMDTLREQIKDGFKTEYMAMSNSERVKIKGYIVNGYVACGKTREEAMDIVNGWEFEAKHGFAWDDRKKAFVEGKVTESKLRQLMTEKGMKESEINTAIADYRFSKEYPNYSISDAKSRDWYDYVKGTGLSVAVYVKFVDDLKACKGTDLNKDGKADEGSAKRQKQQLMRSMENLTPAQRRALMKVAGLA